MNALNAYRAQRNFQNGGNDRRNGDNQRQPNQYRPGNDMDEHRPRDTGMERGGDSSSRMTYEDDGPESRYRGRDGRWKAGRRRSEYDGGAYDMDQTARRMGDDEEDGGEMRDNVIPWPGSPHMPPQNRSIGFGANPQRYETRSHYDGGKAEAEVGGTMWMKPVHNRDRDETPELDRETAEKWVREMHNEDSARPMGGRWSMEELKPMAQKFGIKPDSDEFVEFYAMTNAMYSDYCEVAKKFNITSPEFYGMMAKAWMDDKDAMPDKTALYYEYIVKK